MTRPSSTQSDPVRVKVKVCGLTRVEDALACARAGTDWVGLNFHPLSPRCVDLALAAEIIAALPPDVEPVGLFVDRPPEEVGEVARRLGLRIVQLHGQEPPDNLQVLRHLRIIRAFRLGDMAAVARMTAYLDDCRDRGRLPDAVLIDAHVPGQAGGTGREIAHDILSALPPLPHLILAGGLTPGNVTERIAHVRPWMVDVASGVESVPGRKDQGRITAFMAAVRKPPPDNVP